MTPVDEAALRAAAEAANNGPWFEPDGIGAVIREDEDAAFIALANPAAILALLDAWAADRARAETAEHDAALAHQTYLREVTWWKFRAETAERDRDALAQANASPVAVAHWKARAEAAERDAEALREALKRVDRFLQAQGRIDARSQVYRIIDEALSPKPVKEPT